MATPQENLAKFQEIAKRGLQDQLDPEMRVRFDEAITRGIITAPEQQQQVEDINADIPTIVPTGRPNPAQVEPFQFSKRPLTQKVRGTGEMLLTFATGAGSTIAGGVAGTIDLISNLVSGDDDALGSAVDLITEFQETGTFQPRTRAGEESLQAVSAPIEALFNNIIRPTGNAITDATGSPALATAFEAGAELFPPGVASLRRGGFRQRVVRNREGRQVLEEVTERTGVEFGDDLEAQVRQMSDAAATQTNGRAARGLGFEAVQDGIVRARQRTRDIVDGLYERARSTGATIPVREIQTFADSVATELKSIDIRGLDGKILENRQVLAKRLSEIEAILELPDNAAIKLNALSDFRARLNRNTGDPSQNTALGIVKGELDGFLETMFEADMVSGDPAAIARWKEARSAFNNYRETFSDNRTIKNLATQEATPEQVRSWIFGASAVGAKAEASAVVKKIADIVGRDSPQFAAIRQDALFEIMEPLLQPEPNIKRFQANYDRIVSRNPSLVKELFPESDSALKDLRRLSSSSVNVTTPKFRVNIINSVAKAFFGHSLAQGQLRINFATQIIRQLVNTATKSRKRQVAADFLGYDPFSPVLPLTSAVVGGAIETGANIEQTFPPIGQLPN